MDWDDKKEFLEALRRTPELVQSESHPVNFLVVEDYNPWSAAKRLTLYWKYRKQVFGEPRWLKQIDLSGNGALTPKDVENIRQGCVALRTYSDAIVVLTDFTKAPNDHGGDSSFPSRASFFVAATIFRGTSHPPIERQRIAFLHTVAPQLFLRRSSKGRAFEVARQALPLRVLKIFLLSRKSHSFLDQSIVKTCFSMMRTVAEFFVGELTEFITEDCKEEAFGKLCRFGIPVHCIPTFLNGTWDVPDGNGLWNENYPSNILPSRSSPASSSSKQITSFATASSSTISAAAVVAPKRKTKATMAVSEMDNAKKGKGKRGRPSVIMTEEEERDFRAECEGEDDFIKKKNALYSKRLYYKKKKQETDLRYQVNQIREANAIVRNDNLRLEGLLRKAGHEVGMFFHQQQW
jgi:hypothetical protein